PGSAGFRGPSRLRSPERVVEIEAGSLLALRILPDGSDEFPDVSLGRHQQEDVVDKPIVVGDRSDVGALERISAESEQLWHAKGYKRLGPDTHRAGLPLFREH